jgi:hypothetical protein
MKMEPLITPGGTELLDRVEPPWDRLRQHHALCDPHWSDSLLSRTFGDAELTGRRV